MAANIPVFTSWSTTAGSNQPDGTDTAAIVEDLQKIQAEVRKYTATKGADIASATITNLAGATGNYVHITGTTTIEEFGTVSVGVRFLLVFDGILQLTHDATKLILPTEANITTAAGDRCEVVSLGSGNFRCLWYQKASGLPLAGFQPLDADLTAIAALTTEAFGRSLLTQADAGAARTTLELATVDQAEAEAGTATTTRAWTAERVKQAIAALPAGIGVGQTWQLVTRNAGTTYTNTTGKPIGFSLRIRNATGGASTASATITVAGLVVASISDYGTSTSGHSAFVIIPAGAEYSYTNSLTTISVHELR
jgi:hypothetical protein